MIDQTESKQLTTSNENENNPTWNFERSYWNEFKRKGKFAINKQI